MSDDNSSELTQLLNRGLGGDTGAREKTFARIYRELREMASAFMASERTDHTWQPTALVNECYLRLFGKGKLAEVDNRAHFFGAAARTMRRLLIDHARERNAQKRPQGKTTLDEHLAVWEKSGLSVLALNEALEKLQQVAPRQHQVVELRLICRFEVREIGQLLSLSESSVYTDLRNGRAFLKKMLKENV